MTKDKIKNAVATDRVGNFFSPPRPPVTINLRQTANGRNAPRSGSMTKPAGERGRNNIHHTIHNNIHPQQHNNRPRPPPQRTSLNRPQHNPNNLNRPQHNLNNLNRPQHNLNSLNRPQHNPNSLNRPQHNLNRPQHNLNRPEHRGGQRSQHSVRQHSVSSGQEAVPSRHNNVRLPQNFNSNIQLRQGRMLEDINSLQNGLKKEGASKEPETTTPAEDTEDIVMTFDFEDFEAKMQTERAAFIDPGQLEVTGEAESGHDHEAGGHHEAGHGEEHSNNLTQASDPHGEQQFCVDISEYLDLKWVIKDSEECHVTFTK